ncbi:hypothetical protein D3W54_01230 [Komagataeibacter medellinensis]|uniref:Uncharacterized protein n=1 Tax=Komagataeibacter medellinensis TaxID=1177712 RepID=A0ABQ6VTU1_9PROT|nr:hypothetical protein [Komagataeibacter medellinensis]KAB8123070.1 hypothetical protein D3W54_01230 [Komagataeibacter medellinensis]
MSDGYTAITGNSLTTTAAVTIDYIEQGHEKWDGKGPNDLIDAIHKALSDAADAANSGNFQACSYQTMRAAAYALLLATVTCAVADQSAPSAVH